MKGPWEEYAAPAAPAGETATGPWEEYAAPRGSAGATPEPVANVPVPASDFPEADVYGEKAGNDSMAALRGFGDTMTLNFAPKIGAVIESGQMGGTEYERVLQENRDLRAADDPNARSAGELLGMLGSGLIPAGAAGQVAGIGRQMLVGGTTGAAMGVASGAGAAETGKEFDNAGLDALIGAGAGLVAPGLAAGARKIAQVFGARPDTAAVDALLAAIPPAARQKLGAEVQAFFAAQGRMPALAEILPTGAARKLTNPLNRSETAAADVVSALETARNDLAPSTTKKILTDPNPGAGLVLANAGYGAVPGQRLARGEDAFVKTTNDRADVEFSAFRQAPVSTAGPSGVIINDAISNSTLTSLGKEEFAKAVENNALTAGQLIKLRQNLYTRARQKPGEGFKEIADNIDQILREQVPEAGPALDNYRRGMSAAEGAKVGTAAANRDTPLQTREALASLKPEQLAGVAPGARLGLVERAVRAPSQSYAFAKQLSESPGYQSQVRQLLPPGEGDALVEFALSQKRAIDNLADLAKVPKDKLESLLDNADEMTGVIAAVGFGAGGAFKAALIRGVLARSLPIGKKAAENLSGMLLDKRRRDVAIQALVRAGLPRNGVRELVQGAFISTANTLNTADRKPE